MHYLTDIIVAFGYIGIIVTIFAESGVLIGFFLPGDSLLFTVGLLASQGYFNITILVIGCIIAAVAGDNFGYYMGRKLGPKIFTREDSFFFNKKHIERTRDFFLKHGKKSIILARFTPIIRTFIPIFAGVGNMHYPTFMAYNVIGGVIWAGGILLISYFIGQKIPGVERYLSLIVAVIILASVIPFISTYWKGTRKKT